MKSSLSGVQLYGWHPFKAALYQQMREALQPQMLVDINWCQCRTKQQNSSFTVPMPVILESSRQFFVEFWVSAAKTSNGCPSVGIIDAEKACHLSKQLGADMSRPRQASDTLGISCNPYTGVIHASCTPKYCEEVEVLSDPQEPHVSSQRSWRAEVSGWESGEEATVDDQSCAIEMGMLISNGSLQFIRKGPEGWQRSGVVWDRLPAKILCCAFLFDFVGEAMVSIEKVHVQELPKCFQKFMQETDRDLSARGKLSTWKGWPSS